MTATQEATCYALMPFSQTPPLPSGSKQRCGQRCAAIRSMPLTILTYWHGCWDRDAMIFCRRASVCFVRGVLDRAADLYIHKSVILI